ncbi:hypothetical protein BDZ89DRAFT_1249909 [Hymenopellis radicata]|nr:hypothetical protein BDZ89DRAFT_1249909 [Hymenopellis radicata]
MSAKTALIIGATGQVGSNVLRELLASSHYSKVGEYGRRLTDISSLGAGKEKLEQKNIDFEKLGESGLKDGKWDVVFITLGTNKKSAGSAEAFEKIDRTYVVNSAKEARVEGLTQRVVYCSSIGADPKSSVLYSRSKGLTEQELSGLGYSDAIMYRPAVIAGTNRAEKRMTETVFTSITGVLSHFTSAVEIKSLAMAGFLGTEGLPAEAKAKKAGEAPRTFTLVENAGAVGLANTPWE